MIIYQRPSPMVRNMIANQNPMEGLVPIPNVVNQGMFSLGVVFIEKGIGSPVAVKCV